MCGRNRGHELKPEVRQPLCLNPVHFCKSSISIRVPHSGVCSVLSQKLLRLQVIERAKRAMAGIFDGSASDGTKSHIKNVFGDMYKRKQLRHMPRKKVTDKAWRQSGARARPAEQHRAP